MAYEKITYQKILGITQVTSAQTLAVGGVSNTGTVVLGNNLFVGHKMWDNLSLWLDANGNASTATVVVHGTVCGVSFPIAQRAVGANISGMTTIPSTTSTPCMPRPRHIQVDFSGTSISNLQVFAMGKAGHGQAAGQQSIGSGMDRVVEAPILIIGNSKLTGAGTNGFEYASTDYTIGISADTNIVLNAGASFYQAGASAWGMFGGLEKMKYWDNACFYFNSIGSSGNWNISLQSQIQGITVVVARVLMGAMATTTAGTTRVALTSMFNGPCPTPTRINLDNIGGGVSAQLNGTLYVMAKATRGTRHKI